MDRNWVWASSGLCAGCLIGICVSKLTGVITTQSNKKGTTPKKETVVNHFNKFNDKVTTYSNITMLLGTPTSSGLLETQQEYHMYPADKSYPLLDGNRYVCFYNHPIVL